MKKILMLCLSAVALILFSFIDDNPMTGRWGWTQVYHGTPIACLVSYKKDGSFTGFVNKKAFVTGSYSVRHDTLWMSDPICNAAYSGSYKLHFYGQQDSVRFTVIQDTCPRRKKDMDGRVMKKIKDWE